MPRILKLKPRGLRKVSLRNLNPKESLEIISKYKPVEIAAKKWAKAAVIFFHGANDTGDGIKEWIEFTLKKAWYFNHIKIIYPTAPLRPYTPMKGNLSSVWFDRQQISPFCDENLDSIDATCNDMLHLINREVAHGIPRNKIILGGFSMGGGLAMHLAYRFCTDVAGVFALSSFLNHNSSVYDAVHKAKSNMQHKSKQMPPLFYYHGRKDEVVLLPWMKDTCLNLAFSSVNITQMFDTNMYHELKKKELLELEKFILKILNKNSKV